VLLENELIQSRLVIINPIRTSAWSKEKCELPEYRVSDVLDAVLPAGLLGIVSPIFIRGWRTFLLSTAKYLLLLIIIIIMQCLPVIVVFCC
jgi:hypothetical protein